MSDKEKLSPQEMQEQLLDLTSKLIQAKADVKICRAKLDEARAYLNEAQHKRNEFLQDLKTDYNDNHEHILDPW